MKKKERVRVYFKGKYLGTVVPLCGTSPFEIWQSNVVVDEDGMLWLASENRNVVRLPVMGYHGQFGIVVSRIQVAPEIDNEKVKT